MQLPIRALLAVACLAAPTTSAFTDTVSVHPTPAQSPAPPIPTPEPATKLAVGAQAPALSIESWVKGTPVPALEKGKVYLIQFWAPWSKTSVEQFALVSDLAKKHAEKGLVVIAIASADLSGTTLDKVEAAVAEKGDAIQFSVAWDKGTATKDAFLKAAGRTALPCCVLVDANGKIAFLESATRVGPFLQPVLDGTHDLTAIAAWQAKAERVPQTRKSLETAAQARKWPEIVALSAELIDVDPIEHGTHAQLRIYAEAVGLAAPDKALAWAKAFTDGPGWNSPEGMNAVAWTIVDPLNPFPKKDLELARKAADRAVDLTKGEDGAILDTQARVFFLMGDVQKAIAIQKKAIEKLKPAQAQFRAQLEAALKEYEAVK